MCLLHAILVETGPQIFTCDENGRLLCQKIPLIEDLLSVVNISHAQILLTWIDEGPRSLME